MSSKPITIVIFGATGDLFQKKLAGALFDLHVKGMLPKKFEIIGFSRKPFSHDDFRSFIKNALLARGAQNGNVEEFVSHALYHQGDLSDEKSYGSLGTFIEERDKASGTCSDKLFYLAVPPNLYETVFTPLSASGLTVPCAPGLPNEEKAWTRVLVEKPFGNNEKEAARLDRMLGKLFAEEQIFRIDHSLAKETMQNIISFRFSNGLFEPLWDRKHIERVEIKFLKKDDVSGRGSFYDGVGALRDVGQNHLLQMLALVGMENPKALQAEHIRKARAHVLKKVQPSFTSMLRGQYEGYRQEKGVSSSSSTETYFRLTAHIQNNRWRGVPFMLESGKALKDNEVSIAVFFKPTPCLCPDVPVRTPAGVRSGGEVPHYQNVVTFSLEPKDEISVLFWAKRPGFDFQLEPKRLSFLFAEGLLSHQIPNAYERVLLDAIRGDQTLFASTEEVKAQWKITTPILERWSSLPLHAYHKGSAGPQTE